jgi:holo-[acyl-carrier protein] synthase
VDPAVNVIGVGVDLVDLERIARLLADKGEQAMLRFFTDGERAYLASRPEPTGHAAARIAAKEAVYKALQSLPGARGVGWREIEVVREGLPHALRHFGWGGGHSRHRPPSIEPLAIPTSAV